MAAATTALRACIRTIARPRASPSLLHTTRPLLPHRTLTTTALRWRPADKSSKDSGAEYLAADDAAAARDEAFLSSVLSDIPPEERTPELAKELGALEAELEEQDRLMHKSLDEQEVTLFKEPKPLKDSFWFDEEDENTMTHDIEGEDFDEDDMPSMAHGKLDELREYRHYARVVAWEMPLLAKLAKPFEPPKENEPLRFRYTTYLGESHPAQRKVVVTFCPGDLGLTAEQELKLKKLAGPRYNPEKDVIKMSCESHDHQAQNKRHLADQVDKLLEAAKDPTDMFADIPLDLRHHPVTPKLKFPAEWRLTDARRKELDEIRARAAAKDLTASEEGKLLDGSVVLNRLLAEQPAVRERAVKEKVLERVGGKRR
ncbi:uncharacterized protein DNG_02409 [Cephalotrichum gorgonifer]|uniref:Small ribosomal subunit protein mS35 mitochondrial conserved domain-containing protein n=1 Tax=Cephalotrichum gorgonifer TaxID=2041049 RepID=A0AAE8MSD1_9PEZI|nr:uncharacterized protein DNG_02409 [Cephalotrichum gorgonifer]